MLEADKWQRNLQVKGGAGDKWQPICTNELIFTKNIAGLIHNKPYKSGNIWEKRLLKSEVTLFHDIIIKRSMMTILWHLRVHHGLGKSGHPAQSGKALALWSDRSAQILASDQHRYKHRINTNINSGSTQIADGSTKILIPDQHKYYQRINTNIISRSTQIWGSNIGSVQIWAPRKSDSLREVTPDAIVNTPPKD